MTEENSNQVEIAMLNPVQKKKRIKFSEEEKRRRTGIGSTKYRHKPENEWYREYLRGRNRILSKKPEAKRRKNIRARLGRYKIKLNKALPLIWKNRGLI